LPSRGAATQIPRRQRLTLDRLNLPYSGSVEEGRVCRSGPPVLVAPLKPTFGSACGRSHKGMKVPSRQCTACIVEKTAKLRKH
jgi:hypothetical protein